jgi:hypothetical protein
MLSSVVECNVAFSRKPSEIIGIRERLLELRAIELGEGPGDAAVAFVCLKHKDNVLLVLERIANLFQAPFTTEHFLRQEQNKVSAEAHAFVHAIWVRALLLVDPNCREPMPSLRELLLNLSTKP